MLLIIKKRKGARAIIERRFLPFLDYLLRFCQLPGSCTHAKMPELSLILEHICGYEKKMSWRKKTYVELL